MKEFAAGFLAVIAVAVVCASILHVALREQSNTVDIDLRFQVGQVIDLKIGGHGQIVDVSQGERPYLVRVRSGELHWMREFELDITP